MLKMEFKIQVYNSINESVNHSSQFISVKVKKNLRKSEAQFRRKLRKLKLRQNNDFLIKKRVYHLSCSRDYMGEWLSYITAVHNCLLRYHMLEENIMPARKRVSPLYPL